MDKSQKLNIYEFGERLIDTRDLDPIYCGLDGAQLSYDDICKWIIAYACFYDEGTATFFCTMGDSEYWKYMRIAAANVVPSPLGGRWPRSSQRRHFRAKLATDAVEKLAEISPQERITNLLEKSSSAYNFIRNIESWPQFGPCISFKVMDLINRLLKKGPPVPADIRILYDSPKNALFALGEPQAELIKLVEHFKRFFAPPSFERKCGVLEVETICCKWSSYYFNSRYYIGKDIKEERDSLAGWGPLAERVLANMPEVV